jgi:glycosyltransferase involved in cell wall biosynthesis
MGSTLPVARTREGMVPLRAGGPHYYPLRPDSNIGGEVYERMLVERLPDHGVDLVLGLPRDHQLTAPIQGVEVESLRHRLDLHWTRAPLAFTPFVVRLLRSRRVDVLRGHSVRYAGPSLLLGRSLARSGTPVVLHHHHFFPRWRRLEAAILRRADAVVTVSEHSRAELIAAGVAAERVHVVFDGVARPPRTDGWVDAWPAGTLRLLHVGRLEARKRPGVAVSTVAELRRSGIQASLVLAGEGPELPALVAQARASGIGDCVRFLGRVPEASKWRLYDSADALLFASTLEGFGLVVAEAQSRGLPVVAAEGTASAEALAPGDSGFLVASEGEAFAAAVRQLLDPERRAAIGERAERFASRFDWDRCAAGVADVYRRAAASSAAASSAAASSAAASSAGPLR